MPQHQMEGTAQDGAKPVGPQPLIKGRNIRVQVSWQEREKVYHVDLSTIKTSIEQAPE